MVETPPDWKEVELGDVCSRINDIWSDRNKWYFERYIGGDDFDSGEIRIKRSNPIKGNEKVIGYQFQWRFQPGDVLYVVKNPRLRKAAMVDFEGICSISSFVIRTDNSKLLQKLLPFLLQTENFVFHACNNAHGSTNPFLNWKDIAKYKFLLPPLDEQKKISEILWAIEDNIEKTEYLIEITEKLKKELLEELLTKGIEHKKFKKTVFGVTPEDWEVISLQEMLDRKIILSHLDGNHGSNYPRAHEFLSEGIPYISATNLVDGKVDFKSIKYLSLEKAEKLTKGIAKNGDVLFANNATVGPCAILETDEKKIILSTSLTYYRCNLEQLSNIFLYFYMISPLFQNQLEQYMKQTTRNQIPITTQRKLLLIFPPLDEQKEIEKILSSIILYNLMLKKQIINIKKLKMKITNSLLSGVLLTKKEARA